MSSKIKKKPVGRKKSKSRTKAAALASALALVESLTPQRPAFAATPPDWTVRFSIYHRTLHPDYPYETLVALLENSILRNRGRESLWAAATLVLTGYVRETTALLTTLSLLSKLAEPKDILPLRIALATAETKTPDRDLCWVLELQTEIFKTVIRLCERPSENLLYRCHQFYKLAKPIMAPPIAISDPGTYQADQLKDLFPAVDALPAAALGDINSIDKLFSLLEIILEKHHLTIVGDAAEGYSVVYKQYGDVYIHMAWACVLENEVWRPVLSQWFRLFELSTETPNRHLFLIAGLLDLFPCERPELGDDADLLSYIQSWVVWALDALGHGESYPLFRETRRRLPIPETPRGPPTKPTQPTRPTKPTSQTQPHSTSDIKTITVSPTKTKRGIVEAEIKKV
jgi:hypothetical protein